MKKFVKFVFKVVIFLFFLVVIIQIVLKNEPTLQEKVMYGQLQNLSTEDYMYVKIMSLDKYFNYLKENDFESAYLLLSDEYKKYMSFDEFVDYVGGINLEDVFIQNIKVKNEYCFIAEVKVNGEIEDYVIFMNKHNNKSLKISPNGLLDYVESNKKIRRDNLEVEVKDYVINIDNISVNLLVRNTSKNDSVKIRDFKFVIANDVEKDTGFEELELSAQDTKELNIVADSSYDFLEGIKIAVDYTDERIKVYSFDI